MKQPWTETKEALFTTYQTDAHGLSGGEAQKRLAQYGENKLIEGKQKSVLRVFAEQFADLLVVILLIAAIISALTGGWEGTIVIITVLILNAILGTVQHFKAQKSLESLKAMSAPHARVLRDGEKLEISALSLVPGDILLLEAGDIAAADGRILENYSLQVNESALTGESENINKTDRPLDAEELPLGDRLNMVYSGSPVAYGRAVVLVTATGMDTEMGKIAHLMASAQEKETPLQKSLDDFSKKLSILILIICAIVFALGVWRQMGLGQALMFAVALAVAAIPEALSSIVTIGLAIGTQKMAKQNAIIKKLRAVEALGSVSVICSDKTGTLTKGRFSVTEVKGDVLKPAAIGEAMSNHPIAQAIVQAYKGELPAAQSYQELGGYGISYELDGETVLLGNSRLMEHEKIAYEKANGIGTVVYVAKGGKFLGYILVADTLKENIADSLAALRKQGIRKMVMLTGDRRETAAAVAEELQLDEFHSELLPENKVEWMEKQKGAEGDKTAFVGDGINDAPVLAAADLGIAMGAIGSDAAIEAADVVLMDDDVRKIASIVRISRKTLSIVKQNIVFALGVKAIVLLLGAFGAANMWEAVFADVGVSVIAILNSMRALKEK